VPSFFVFLNHFNFNWLWFYLLLVDAMLPLIILICGEGSPHFGILCIKAQGWNFKFMKNNNKKVGTKLPMSGSAASGLLL
jgi:hypothetical protein